MRKLISSFTSDTGLKDVLVHASVSRRLYKRVRYDTARKCVGDTLTHWTFDVKLQDTTVTLDNNWDNTHVVFLLLVFLNVLLQKSCFQLLLFG